MRTKITIMMIVGGIVLAAIGATVALAILLGPVIGLGIAGVAALAVVVLYKLVIQPWHGRWGATDEEVLRHMPGDHIIPEAASSTRAISIRARPDEIWPWLVQIGYGRAGWYSYDWIDNDGRPSADRVVPELQDLRVGDRILMVPGMGPEVRAIEPPEYILSGDREAGTWCLALYGEGGETRLVSRWRQKWARTPAVLFWIAISDPGAFIMERKMLLGIRRRVEHAVYRRTTTVAA